MSDKKDINDSFLVLLPHILQNQYTTYKSSTQLRHSFYAKTISKINMQKCSLGKEGLIIDGGLIERETKKMVSE